jgi:hypothetical protein
MALSQAAVLELHSDRQSLMPGAPGAGVAPGGFDFSFFMCALPPPGATPFAFKAYEQVFAHLYECSTDKAGAKLLVDRILARLARTDTKKKT